MRNTFSIAFLLIVTSILQAQNPNKIIEGMLTAIGGKENFYKLKNVTFQHEHKDPESKISLIGKETYAFNQEKSDAIYKEHLLLGNQGIVVEGFNGEEAWISFSGKIATNKEFIGIARFLRKANYYFFTMFYKLNDKGVNLTYNGIRKVDGKEYDLVKIIFNEQVGDVQYTFILYINKKTKLVDQYLFTVVGFGKTETKLMKIKKYEIINGIKIPTKRADIQSNWKGEIVGKGWGSTTLTNIKFNQKMDLNLFNKFKNKR